MSCHAPKDAGDAAAPPDKTAGRHDADAGEDDRVGFGHDHEVDTLAATGHPH